MTNDERTEELARHYDELVEKGQELDDLVPVNVRVRKGAGEVYTLRLTRDEADIIGKAADALGIARSSFIRESALAAAAGGLDRDAAAKAAQWQAVKAKTRELLDAVNEVSA